MKRYKVLNKRGVHSMSAGRSWYLNQYVLAGELPERLIAVLIEDGAIVEEVDAVEVEPEPVEEAEPVEPPKPRTRKPKAE